MIAGFPAADPLDLARATVYLPTQRAASAFARELMAASGARALILPRIAPLGAFEPLIPPEPEDEAPRLTERAAVSALARRMTLSRLVSAWGRALKGAIRRVDAAGRLIVDVEESPLVATSSAQAFHLSGDLAALIDDMVIEGVDPERLKTLEVDRFDNYWGITLDFLKIAFEAWPQWLDAAGLIDRARLTAARVDEEIAALAGGLNRGPLIIAGSTGANRATARLIAAIAKSPQGAVVLPNLDKDLDDDAFALLNRPEEEAGPVAGHPQALLSRLIGFIGVERRDVTDLGAPRARARARSRLLSEALRPAESTSIWPERRKDLGEAAIADGLADVSLVVAENEYEEALTLAVAMREALQTPGRTAALITPEATLARRVAAELARWGVQVENSAGRTLGDTPAGALARLTLTAAAEFTPQAIAALLRHPRVRLGRETFEADARALELALLRAPLPPSGLDDIDAALAAARLALDDPHAHPALKSLGPSGLAAAAKLMTALSAALAPLRALTGEAPLGAFIAAHRAALAALAPVAAGADGAALDELFDEWAASAEGFEVSSRDYAQIFDAVASATRAPPLEDAHPRLAILGLLEARLLAFDLVLIGGLDETVWPPAAETDAFLNRTMRADLGLSAPERRIGQTAHDFVDALGAPRAILTRAKKRGGAPTVASRFLQRLGAVAGDEHMVAMEARGARWLALARSLDRSVQTTPIARPEPRPPLELRPKQLSVTRIETLRRDPYAIYAEYILKLKPLPEIGASAGPSEIGVLWHAALQAFAQNRPQDESDNRARLLACLEAAFAPLNADPAFRALRWPRVLIALDEFLKFDAGRGELASVAFYELAGALPIAFPGAPPFKLTARADRIEKLKNGGAAIIDYKTGAPPGDREIAVGFAPQMTLEAAMLKRGAFASVGAEETKELIHYKLGGAEGGRAKAVKPPEGMTIAALAEAHYGELLKLIAQFSDPETPYLARPFPKFVGRGADYDHLARVKEWAATGDAGDEE